MVIYAVFVARQLFSQIYAVLSWGKFCRKFTHFWGENFPGLKCGCGKKWLIWGMAAITPVKKLPRTKSTTFPEFQDLSFLMALSRKKFPLQKCWGEGNLAKNAVFGHFSCSIEPAEPPKRPANRDTLIIRLFFFGKCQFMGIIHGYYVEGYLECNAKFIVSAPGYCTS